MKIRAVSLEAVHTHTHTHTICLANKKGQGKLNKKIDISSKKDSDINL